MKRLLLIAAAVLVPFGVLVAWALSALGDPPPMPPPAQESPAPMVAEVAPAQPRPEPALPAVVPAPAPAPAAPADEPPEPAPPPGDAVAIRAAVLEQLTPVVNTCFLDMAGPLKQAIRVSATFEADENGAIKGVKVKMKSADPYLVACVQDALEGATLDKARGLPQGPVRHTFSFKPDGYREPR